MQKGNFKNTIVLKNIPSNLIEEAIIVLKENKKAWKLEKVNKIKNDTETILKPIKKEYIVKEAELIISDYEEEIKKKEKENQIENKNAKYKRLKRYSYFVTVLLLLQILSHII